MLKASSSMSTGLHAEHKRYRCKPLLHGPLLCLAPRRLVWGRHPCARRLHSFAFASVALWGVLVYWASLSAFCFFVFWFSGPRFENWDIRIRPQGGNITENLIFRSKMTYSCIQRPQIRTTESSFFCFSCFEIFMIHFSGGGKASAVALWVVLVYIVAAGVYMGARL